MSDSNFDGDLPTASGAPSAAEYIRGLEKQNATLITVLSEARALIAMLKYRPEYISPAGEALCIQKINDALRNTPRPEGH